MEIQQHSQAIFVKPQQIINRRPQDLHPSSPPVKMRSDPHDLPLSLLPNPQNLIQNHPSLKSKLSSLPTLPVSARHELSPHHSLISNQGTCYI